jgi:hypothetical protein
VKNFLITFFKDAAYILFGTLMVSSPMLVMMLLAMLLMWLISKVIGWIF